MEKLRQEIKRLKKHRLNNYESHCELIERYLEERPDISIESCKAILEGISKLVIHLLTQEPLSRLNSSNFDNLFKWALNAIEEKGGRDFRFDPDFIKRMGAAVKYLGEIRNQHSDVSHGRASLKEQVSDADLAEMVAGITDSIGTYMLRKLENLNHFPTDSDLDYSRNDDFNLATDESHPIEGGLSYSKALYDQDPIGYQEWLENWRSEFNPE
ncbi:MAG: abortive infection family protein [Acidiferrobacterales bacterium]|nr:abortive infection family protein [Acidiferrobacterales bacterium]